MKLDKLIEHLGKGLPVKPGTPLHDFMVEYSNEAMQITSDLNSLYHPQGEIRELMSRLTGKKIDESFTLFPPFYSDFGKNITIGKNVFINACCCFQDQGGITIGDGVFIGHKVVLRTKVSYQDSHDERTSCQSESQTL